LRRQPRSDPNRRGVVVEPQLLDPDRDDADDLTLVVAYEDGDGDLGGGAARVHDCRGEGLTIELAIPPIASQEAVDQGVAISGELALIINDVGALAEVTSNSVCSGLGVAALAGNQVAFCVELVDMAGNTGPGACSAMVALGAVE
jgi:hypothetical protein